MLACGAMSSPRRARPAPGPDGRHGVPRARLVVGLAAVVPACVSAPEGLLYRCEDHAGCLSGWRCVPLLDEGTEGGFCAREGDPLADLCPNDPEKVVPGACGCGVVEDDPDRDGACDGVEVCDGKDNDGDEAIDEDVELCPEGELCYPDGGEFDCRPACVSTVDCFGPVPAGHARIQLDDRFFYRSNTGSFKVWQDARAFCVSEGGDLASLHDEPTHQFLRGQVFLTGSEAMWIGLSDLAEEGVWTWSDGTPFDFEAWADNEPGTDPELSDCVALWNHANNEWNDFSCDAISGGGMGYVCEIPPPRVCTGIVCVDP